MCYSTSILLCILLAVLLPANAIEQPAEVNADIDVTFTSIQPTKNGLQVSVSYVSHLTEPIQFTLTYPQDKAGFASDNLGNEYILANATGMARKHEDANQDFFNPGRLFETHSTFLLAPPNKKVSASFLFKRTTQDAEKEKPIAFNISISHYARPATKFDPRTDSLRAFGFTAAISNAKPL